MNERIKYSTKNRKFLNYIKEYKPLSDLIIGLIGLAIAILGIFTVASVININTENSVIAEVCNIYGTENRTLAGNLYTAQTYYDAEKYTQAIEIYAEHSGESAVACINLGYLYSKGLGVNKNFDTACTYYKKAYEMGLEEGMYNYIALNLQNPNSYKDVSKALKFGIEHGYVKAMLFAAYFEKGTMYADYSKEVFEYAVDFINRPQYEQDVKMKEKIYLYEVFIEKTFSETTPKSTEFVEYKMTDIKSYQPKDLKLISVLDFVDEEEYRETDVPIVDFDEVYYYSVYKYHFHCSEELLDESFYYALVD